MDFPNQGRETCSQRGKILDPPALPLSKQMPFFVRFFWVTFYFILSYFLLYRHFFFFVTFSFLSLFLFLALFLVFLTCSLSLVYFIIYYVYLQRRQRFCTTSGNFPSYHLLYLSLFSHHVSLSVTFHPPCDRSGKKASTVLT